MPAAPSPNPGAVAVVTAPLTDRLLRSWLRCRRRAWLDRHGLPERRQWNAHRALALDEQLRCFQQLLPERPGRGEAACSRGDAGVMGLRLAGQLPLPGLPRGLALEAHPPLLQRTEGRSRWGAFAYRPVLARQGRNLTREHRLQLTLWGRLLEAHQQGAVPRALVVGPGDRSLVREQLTLTPALQRQLDESLERLAADLERPEPPPLVNDRKKCVLCGWRSLCDGVAAEEGHLSEVSGIGGKRRDLLLAQGIGSLPELAAADPARLAEELAVHGEQHREVAPQLVAQARVQAAGAPLRRPGAAGEALPELVQAAGVLIYDIESDPDARDDFLHGFLSLRRQADGRWPSALAGQEDNTQGSYTSTAARDGVAAGTQVEELAAQAAGQEVKACAGASGCSFHPLLALHEHGEARLWQRLRTLLERFPDWPVLHYGETESIYLLRLAERQGASPGERQALKARLIDVHQRLRQHWLLPVNSYGLKAVAAWRGFRWSQSGVDGARCLLWWRQWRLGVRMPARSRHQLRRIFTYNRDDCLATWAVAAWLLQQDGC